MATILNVLSKDPEMTKYSTVSAEDLNAGRLPGWQDDYDKRFPKAAATPKDEDWKAELAELERLGVGSLPSVSEAEQALRSLEDGLEAQAKDLTTQARKSRQLASSEAFSLSALDRTELLRGADRLEEKASRLKDSFRMRIARAKDLVVQTRTHGTAQNKKRLQELRTRKAKLDALLADPSKVSVADPINI